MVTMIFTIRNLPKRLHTQTHYEFFLHSIILFTVTSTLPKKIEQIAIIYLLNFLGARVAKRKLLITIFSYYYCMNIEKTIQQTRYLSVHIINVGTTGKYGNTSTAPSLLFQTTQE